MKALVKFDKGRAGMALREVEIPEPGEGELLIRILAAGICGTDLHIMKDHYPCTPPVVLGQKGASNAL